MNEGWVKLHRRLKENDMIKDTIACQVFLFLLLDANRKTGVVKTGRIWLSRFLSIGQSTLYKVLKRMEKRYEVIEIKSNSQGSDIRLLNWAKYQSTEEMVTGEKHQSNIIVTSEQHQSNTLQERENKELRIKNIKEINKEKFSSIDLLGQLDFEEIATDYQTTLPHVISCLDDLKSYCERTGKKYKNYKAALRHFVKSDALKRKEEYVREQTGKSKIGFVPSATEMAGEVPNQADR